ncbi:MAG: hypothetical protein AB1390_06245 [Nitrospirota bacterium]
MKMRIGMAMLSFFFAVFGYLSSPAKVSASDIDLHFGIGIGVPPPPRVVIYEPPPVFLIPQTPVYYAPYAGVDLFFYSGYWYLLRDGYWFRAAHYSGPWVSLPHRRLPTVFVRLSPDYHRISPGRALIPYGQLKKHWAKREKDYHRGIRKREKDQHHEWEREHRTWKKWDQERHDRAKYRF